MEHVDIEWFRAVFRENILRRSRSAQGKNVQGMGGAKTETSSKKRPMLLDGEALKARVAGNAERLIEDVLAANPPELGQGGQLVRARCERWFDIANDGLYGPDAYREEFDALEAGARRLEQATGEAFPLNRRYRLWTPEYTTIQVSPVLLERFMTDFYAELWMRLRLPCERHDVLAARVMAWADLMMDGELHPWLDACGRVTTALVMWISRHFMTPPPLFAPTKKEHYAAIRDIDAHAAYFVGCLERSRAFAVAD